jgi:hypothetical protein
MLSKAKTVKDYLASLPKDRRTDIEAVRKVILKNLDKGFEEGMSYGMIGYYVPHKLYPAGYHCDPKMPLPFAGLASQKNHLSLYLFCIYGSNEEALRFQSEWHKTGKKLDMGKSCIRFKKAEDIPLDVVGRTIARVTVARHIQWYEAAFKNRVPQKKPRTAKKKK